MIAPSWMTTVNISMNSAETSMVMKLLNKTR